MSINYIAIGVATVLQFIVGAIWYSALFGKLWGKIHNFDKLPKDVQQQKMKMMGPTYAIQFGVTLVTTFVLAIFMAYQPDWNPWAMAGFMWIGFVLPAQISGVMFGETENKWMVKKVAVQALCALLCLEVAVTVIKLFA